MAWRRAARSGRVAPTGCLMSPETISPETIEFVLAFAIGFAVAGMVATGYQAVTRRPASFRLLRRGPAPATFAAVPFLAFAAPFIIMRSTLRRHDEQRARHHAPEARRN